MKSAAIRASNLIMVILLVCLSAPMGMPVDAQSFSCGDVTEISQVECEALVALYNSAEGDDWDRNTNWLVTNTPSNWYGVTVGSGRVTGIRLRDNNLIGSIPPELGDLLALQDLNLSLNNDGGLAGLVGNIPPELGNLSGLQKLNLSGNRLDGSIPPELGNLTSLQILDLDMNSLSGGIPGELGNLASLQFLRLGSNQLSGSIPPELGNLADLEVLYLDHNQLSGSIPPELGNLAALDDLYLGRNQLSGSIPPELGNLAALRWLDLEANQLSGSIPPELGSLAALEDLDLGSNQLTGSIPPELGNLASLQNLWLWQNELTGGVPPELANLAALDTLCINNNPLTGSIPLSFINLPPLGTFYFLDTYLCEPTTPEYLAWKAVVDDYWGTGISCRVFSCSDVTEIPQTECEALVALYDSTVGDNWTDNTNWLLTDTPSDWHGVTVSNGHVTQIDLSSNGLILSLPPELGDLSALQYLALQTNQLSGHVPLGLTDLSQLDTFYFYETDLCELPRPQYLAWKATVADYQGTGVSCQTWTLMYYQAGDSKDEKGRDMGVHMLWETERLRDASNNPYVSIAILRDTLIGSAVYEAYVDGQTVRNIPQGELNTGDSATLSDFVNWGKSNFPADHYALVMFGHGHGLKGSMQDLTNTTKPEDFLNPKEFRTALLDSGPLDVVFMEACLVANLEQAYQARGQASYYVASEALTFGPLNHRYVSEISTTTNPVQLAMAMAADYYWETNRDGDHSRTISVGDLSVIEQVAQSTNDFAAAIRAHRVDMGIAIWQIIYGNVVQRFEENGDGVISEEDILADLYHFAQLVGWLGEPELTQAADNLMAAIDDYVIYERRRVRKIWDHSHAHGLSVLLTKKLACYYTSDWFDFSGDVSWFCNPGAQAVDQQPGEWGQMLSDYIWEFEPDPEMLFEPPPLLPPHVPPQETLLFLPLILRMSPQ